MVSVSDNERRIVFMLSPWFGGTGDQVCGVRHKRQPQGLGCCCKNIQRKQPQVGAWFSAGKVLGYFSSNSELEKDDTVAGWIFLLVGDKQ